MSVVEEILSIREVFYHLCGCQFSFGQTINPSTGDWTILDVQTFLNTNLYLLGVKEHCPVSTVDRRVNVFFHRLRSPWAKTFLHCGNPYIFNSQLQTILTMMVGAPGLHLTPTYIHLSNM